MGTFHESEGTQHWILWSNMDVFMHFWLLRINSFPTSPRKFKLDKIVRSYAHKTNFFFKMGKLNSFERTQLWLLWSNKVVHGPI